MDISHPIILEGAHVQLEPLASQHTPHLHDVGTTEIFTYPKY